MHTNVLLMIYVALRKILIMGVRLASSTIVNSCVHRQLLSMPDKWFACLQRRLDCSFPASIEEKTRLVAVIAIREYRPAPFVASKMPQPDKRYRLFIACVYHVYVAKLTSKTWFQLNLRIPRARARIGFYLLADRLVKSRWYLGSAAVEVLCHDICSTMIKKIFYMRKHRAHLARGVLLRFNSVGEFGLRVYLPPISTKSALNATPAMMPPTWHSNSLVLENSLLR